MIYHKLIQGSPEWHQHRACHFNASDAPAMMGCSPYKTRSELLHEMHTGMAAEVDEGTQRRFDDGHRFEALARPIAEDLIGEEIYPTTGSEGKLSASFDGLTIDGRIAFEHKMLNDDIRARATENGIDFAMHHRVQMEQQCMVSGATKVLFIASLWNDDDELVEAKKGWYESDPKLAATIRAGWELFAADLAAYSPPEAVAAVTGAAPDALPALYIEITGQVTNSNLESFRRTALAVFAGINRELTTDQHFADAEKTIKWAGDLESRLAAAKDHALSQTASIDELFRTIDDISAEARRVRLDLERLVKARKEQIRADIIAEGKAALDAHVAALNTRLGADYIAYRADFAAAIKGKRTIDSLRNAVDTTLAHAKIATSAQADAIDANLKAVAELTDDMSLLPDLRTLALKPAEDFRNTVKLRIAERDERERKRQESERERIRAEERAKVEREAREAEEKRQAAVRASEEAERRAQAEAAAPAAEPPKPAPTAVIRPVATHRTAVPAPRPQRPQTLEAAARSLLAAITRNGLDDILADEVANLRSFLVTEPEAA